uniref:HTH CENPB-type domain-containing protein n=1 Tax=Anolis carolinensis TaxID=28377 RepID=G1KUP5_ANOCA
MAHVQTNRTFSTNKKRKRLCLSIAQKVKLLEKLDSGVSVKHLTLEYGVGMTTIYDLKKQKDKLLKFYAESDEEKLMKNRKTLHKAKNEDLDRVLKEWIRQRRTEHLPLNGMLIMKQAKIYHNELKIEGNCEYSKGWLQKFKKRHGITFLKIQGGKTSDHKAPEKIVDKFIEVITDKNLTPKQVHNADETSQFGHYCAKKTLTTADEIGIRDVKDRINVLGCANAAARHKCKLVIGKSLHPHCFEGVTYLPIRDYANVKSWITNGIFSDWFYKHCVPAAHAHCRETGLNNDCKILLFLNSCSALPLVEILIKHNVHAIFPPSNVTSGIQPCNQSILRSMKTKYKTLFLNSMLAAVNKGMGVEGFQEFSMKDVRVVTNAWNTATRNTVVQAWHNLWPVTIVCADDEQADEFEGCYISNEKTVTPGLAYTKNITAKPISKLEEVGNEVFSIGI